MQSCEIDLECDRRGVNRDVIEDVPQDAPLLEIVIQVRIPLAQGFCCREDVSEPCRTAQLFMPCCQASLIGQEAVELVLDDPLNGGGGEA